MNNTMPIIVKITASKIINKEYSPAPRIIGIGPMKTTRPKDWEMPPINPAMAKNIVPKKMRRKPARNTFMKSGKGAWDASKSC